VRVMGRFIALDAMAESRMNATAASTISQKVIQTISIWPLVIPERLVPMLEIMILRTIRESTAPRAALWRKLVLTRQIRASEREITKSD